MTVLPTRDTPASAPRVLVVDDSLVNLALAEAMLKDRGVSVDTATSAPEAVAKVRTTAYALVLMDIRMAHEDGIAATRAIRALGGHCSSMPIVALSADDTPFGREACRAAGLDGFIAKPLEFDALDTALQRWCGLAPAPIDFAVFVELRAGISAKDFDDLTERFLSEGPLRMARLRAAATHEDHETVAGEAHVLKSIAALFGARPLMRIAADIERAALRQATCESLVAALSDNLAATCVWLEGQIRQHRTPQECTGHTG